MAVYRKLVAVPRRSDRLSVERQIETLQKLRLERYLYKNLEDVTTTVDTAGHSSESQTYKRQWFARKEASRSMEKGAARDLLAPHVLVSGGYSAHLSHRRSPTPPNGIMEAALIG